MTARMPSGPPCARALLPPITIAVQSGTWAVREALAKLMEQLGPLGLDIEEAGTVELVLAEALNNIVEHAYTDPTCPGPICIRCQHKADGLHLEIRDQGAGLPDGQMPLGNTAPCDAKWMDLPEGGFGWFLICDLAKDIHYERVGSENRLDLRLAVAVRAGAVKARSGRLKPRP